MDTDGNPGSDDAAPAQRPLPGPRPPAHAAPSGAPSRRWFLAGGVALVVGAGAGVGADFLRHRTSAEPVPNPPPATLVAAVEAERTLIADLDATTGGTPAVRQVIRQTRADHAAHLRALSALVAQYRTPTAAASRSSGAGVRSGGAGVRSGGAGVRSGGADVRSGTPRTHAELRRAELDASATAARRARALDGRVATLLASISACEATHAELLR